MPRHWSLPTPGSLEIFEVGRRNIAIGTEGQGLIAACDVVTLPTVSAHCARRDDGKHIEVTREKLFDPRNAACVESKPKQDHERNGYTSFGKNSQSNPDVCADPSVRFSEKSRNWMERRVAEEEDPFQAYYGVSGDVFFWDSAARRPDGMNISVECQSISIHVDDELLAGNVEEKKKVRMIAWDDMTKARNFYNGTAKEKVPENDAMYIFQERVDFGTRKDNGVEMVIALANRRQRGLMAQDSCTSWSGMDWASDSFDVCVRSLTSALLSLEEMPPEAITAHWAARAF
ncbi:hypothetical protein AK812_SmicGene30787 [Symbiodinium microadriaticum]|uniref:Uncharacterized protein n=1 Tax=Symbiodinium microadriaticum TaxID=2951 RepID=A0A1Q9CYC1_SYMMI|nr:hypothetical protein AK812_SmicGene30787 [Symbiodinium microadriaticum]